MASDWPSDVQVPSKRVLCASAQQKRFATTLFASVTRETFFPFREPSNIFIGVSFLLVRCSSLLCFCVCLCLASPFCLRGLGVSGFALFLSCRCVVPCLLCLGSPSRASAFFQFSEISRKTHGGRWVRESLINRVGESNARRIPYAALFGARAIPATTAISQVFRLPSRVFHLDVHSQVLHFHGRAAGYSSSPRSIPGGGVTLTRGSRLMERSPNPVRDQNQSRRCGQSPRRASILPSVRMGQDPQDVQRQVWPTDSRVLPSSSVLLRSVRRKSQRGKASSRNTGSGNQFGRGGSSRTFQTRTPEAASSHSGGKPNTTDASSFHLTDANISGAVADKVSSSFQLVAPGQASSAMPCTLQGPGRTHVAIVVGRAFEQDEFCFSTAAGKLRSDGWARLEPLLGVRISNSKRGLATHGRRRSRHRCSTLGYVQLSPTPHRTLDHVSHSGQCQVRKGQPDQEHSLGKQSQRAREAACQHQEQQVAIPRNSWPSQKILGQRSRVHVVAKVGVAEKAPEKVSLEAPARTANQPLQVRAVRRLSKRSRRSMVSLCFMRKLDQVQKSVSDSRSTRVSIPENAGGSTSASAVAKQVSLATIASAWNLQHEPSPLFLTLRLKTFLSLSK